eukprot:2411264-Alexandrium_andersonii.AAC.1
MACSITSACNGRSGWAYVGGCTRAATVASGTRWINGSKWAGERLNNSCTITLEKRGALASSTGARARGGSGASSACAALLKVSDRARGSALLAAHSKRHGASERAALGATRSTSPAGSSSHLD